MHKEVAIIGAGRVGSSIGHLLAKAGYAITAVAGRSMASAERARTFIGAGEAYADAVKAASKAGIIFITTPDRMIRVTCDAISAGGGFKPGSIVIHMSGAHSLDLLDSAKSSGSFRAVLHPLQSVPSAEQGIKNIPGSYFRMESDPEAAETAASLVKALGGVELAMPKWRPDKYSASLYHAGAAAVSNFFVALVDYGLKFYQALGAEKKDALKAVLPLIKGTLKNIEDVGVPDALTGPIMRGDVKTVQEHLEAMKQRAPELLPLYRELAKRTISVAKERGLAEENAKELLNLLKIEN